MEPKANYAKIVGTPQNGRDSWVVVEDNLFLVLEIGGPADSSVAPRGKEIIDTLMADYQNLSSKNLDNLKQLIENIKIEDGLSLAIILGIQSGKVFYLVCRGAGRVVIRRAGKFGLILSDQGSASGILQDGDVFLLMTPRFSEVVSFDEIKNTFDDLTVSELAESLTSLVHRTEDTSGVAALILQFQAEEERWNNVEEAPSEAPAKIEQSLSSIIQQLKSIFSKSSALYFRRSQPEEEKKKRTVLWVSVILVILLLTSIILGFSKRISHQKQGRFNQLYQTSLGQYEEGKALLGINNLRASSLFGEAKTSLERIKKDFGKNSKEANKIGELLSKIEEELGTASQIYKITPEVFFDLGLIKERAEGKGLGLSEDNLVVLDTKNSSLYQINIKSKAGKILAGGEDFRGSSNISASSGNVFVLTARGILKGKLEAGSWRLEVKKDDEWGEIVDLESFGSNLYLLDKTNSQIWKYIGDYSRGEKGFAEKTRYLTSGRDLNLQNFSKMAIDGAVWLTTDQILKFTQGKQDSFEIKGLEQPFGTGFLLFTSQDTKNLYVLDKTNNRVVILEKNGNYESQYVIENLGGTSDLVASEPNKVIFLLQGSKIYKIELKS